MRVVVLSVLITAVLARPQLDLPPLVGPPPLQIFVPDLQFIRPEPEPQPAPQSAPPPSSSTPPPPPPPPPQPLAKSAPSTAPRNEYRLRFSNEGDITGYSYSVETDDGFQKQEDGEIKQLGPGDAGTAVTGHYTYIGQDGTRYNIAYVADENGFRPKYSK